MRAFVCVLVVLSLSGCGDGIVLVPVSGRVLVDGKPVANLRVSFSPIGTPQEPISGPGSFGFTDEQGRFEFTSVHHRRRGAVPGRTWVRIQATTPASNIKAEDDPKTARAMRRLPARYNDETTLSFEVPPGGTSEADFNIRWK